MCCCALRYVCRIEVATVVLPVMLTESLVPWVVEETLNNQGDVENLALRLKGVLPDCIIAKLKPGDWSYTATGQATHSLPLNPPNP